jgi:hypothetical protein
MPGVERSDVSLFQAESEILGRDRLIPLLYLPRAYAVSGRVRDLRLNPDGSPALADASLLSSPRSDSPRPDSSREDAQ